jgi:hypothetical protein
VVTAYIPSEMSPSERLYWDNYWSSPNRNYIQYFNDGYSSSFRFNCHGYAWNMSEGGPVRWIGYYVTTDDDVYMTDRSYIQVCNETDTDKNFISNHSISKWLLISFSNSNKWP